MTIPMFLGGKIAIDMLLNLETCSDDSTCADSSFCHEGKCVNACDNISCGQNATCQIINHFSSCECLPNFIRNDEGECRKDEKCSDNSTCDDSEFCFEGKCVNACYNKLCGENEGCQIFKHNSTCECLHDFIRDNEGECKKIKKCGRDEDCNSSELCANGMCIIGCNDKCDTNEICQGKNRTFSCECIPNYRRDSDNKCKRQCSYDEICERNKNCQNGFCKTIVIYTERCGLNAVGYRLINKQACTCPRGFGGDPYRHCLKRCKTNYECEDTEICHKNLCANACLPSLKKCPFRQKCEAKNHTVNCLSEPNEYKSCRFNSNCDKKSYCDAGHSLCMPLCDPQSCDDNYICSEDGIFSNSIELRATNCSCKYSSIFVDNSWKCPKPCYSDEVCEENEYCNDLVCVPRREH
ncbi:hypothetical protein PV327_009971 [Microctonus hyperodae]|uniref:EGF-like domain-containing protein n=1 Tax=Microctonus hyperodae TaxID=165561 RepID=A0AA39F236_MICHY|nr:hypothetical protein PV327_009971 [Microctonus hyperodae]